MIDERITDGRRIAQLLASELSGRESGALGTVAVVEANRDVEPAESGAFAYGIDADGDRLADVSVHVDRARIDLRAGLEAGARAADEAGLRVRPKAVDPPRAIVFVESGAEVKRAVDAIVAAVGD